MPTKSLFDHCRSGSGKADNENRLRHRPVRLGAGNLFDPYTLEETSRRSNKSTRLFFVVLPSLDLPAEPIGLDKIGPGFVKAIEPVVEPTAFEQRVGVQGRAALAAPAQLLNGLGAPAFAAQEDCTFERQI
jgi:hypothetical protein